MEGCHEQIRRASELAQGHPSTESTAAVEMVRYLDRVCAGDFEAALQAWDQALPINWRSEYDESDWVLDCALEKAREVGDLPRIFRTTSFVECRWAAGDASQKRWRSSTKLSAWRN